MPELLRAASTSSTGETGFGRAKRCLLLFLTGGPPQLDTWDLKPDAPHVPVAESLGQESGSQVPGVARPGDPAPPTVVS
jgi:hypothetical protein